MNWLNTAANVVGAAAVCVGAVVGLVKIGKWFGGVTTELSGIRDTLAAQDNRHDVLQGTVNDVRDKLEATRREVSNIRGELHMNGAATS